MQDTMKQALKDYLKNLRGEGVEIFRKDLKAPFPLSYKIMNAQIKYQNHLYDQVILYVENKGEKIVLTLELDNLIDPIVKTYDISEFDDF